MKNKKKLMNKKITKRRTKKIQMKTVKKGNNNEKLKTWLHFMLGLVLIVTIIMLKTLCQDIDVFVGDLKNPNFNQCNYLTLVENIAIIKSMNLVNILVVKFYAILAVVLLVKLKFLSNVFVVKRNKELLVKFFPDQNFLVKIHAERNLIVLNTIVNLNVMKGLAYLVKKKLKLIASVEETKSS